MRRQCTEIGLSLCTRLRAYCWQLEAEVVGKQQQGQNSPNLEHQLQLISVTVRLQLLEQWGVRFLAFFFIASLFHLPCRRIA